MKRIAAGTIVLGAVLGAALAAGPVRAQATCSHEPTDGLATVIVGARTYRLYVPQSLQTLPPGTAVPLLLSLHGLGGSGSNHAPNTGWMEFSESEPMVVAFPDGLRSWDNREDSIDVAYLRDVIADIRTTYCVDPHRIHATGHSNGSFMSQRLACDAYDLIASIAPYAGGRPDNGLQGGPCSPERAVPVALFHGDADAVVNIRQGMASRDGWVDRLDCDTAPVVEETADGTEEVYLHCRDGVEVRWHVYPDQSHSWPEGVRRDDMLDRIWEFFERYPHPAPWDEGTTPPSNQPVLTQIEDLKARTQIDLVRPDPLGAIASEAIVVELNFRLEANTIGAAGPAVPGCEPRPLAYRPVRISIGDGPAVEVTTDGQGRASATLAAPATPGPTALRASFDGDEVIDACPGRAGRFKQTFLVSQAPQP